MRTNVLKARMVERGFTQERLAKELGIATQTLNAKLNGRTSLLLDEVISIVKILEIKDAEDIFFN